MRDAVGAIEAALKELIEARDVLPEDFAAEIDRVITQMKVLLDSLAARDPEPLGGDRETG
jgi:hypothetical protein